MLDALRILVQHLLDGLGLADTRAACQREAVGRVFNRLTSRNRQGLGLDTFSTILQMPNVVMRERVTTDVSLAKQHVKALSQLNLPL